MFSLILPGTVEAWADEEVVTNEQIEESDHRER